ncbi:MAG: preprotein translocase subunit YajC [Neisseriaceae bacterium]
MNNATTSAQASPLWSGMVLIAAIFLLFWMLIIRPQTKKLKDHQNLVNSLQRGDKILMHSGIIGKILKIEDKTFIVQIANNVEITVDKAYVAMKYEPNSASIKTTAQK